MARKRKAWRVGDAFVEGFVDQVHIPKGRREAIVWDAALPGFGCRKSSTGRASFIVQYDFAGATRRLSLGAVLDGNLKEMRLAASAVLSKRNLGQDAVADKRAAIAASSGPTFGSLVEDYLKEREAEMKPRSHVEVTRHLQKVCSKLGKRQVAGISRSDIVAVLDKAVDERGPTAADAAKSSLGRFFVWAIDRGYVEANPCNDIGDRAPANGGRQRALSEAELREVWLATDRDHDHDRIVRLLILTGQRREEIGALSKAEWNRAERRLELPPGRTKNSRPHIVPLSEAALNVLAGVKLRDESPYLFGRLETPFSGWSKSKERLDTRIAEGREEAGIDEAMLHWTLHDLRRTFATRMRERRIADSHLVELIINHVSGMRAGVAGVYDRSERLEERREVLEAWGQYVIALGR